MVLKKGKILVVDDDVGVCEAIATALRFDYDVTCAYTGSAGMDAICSAYFDLVFLDYGLPDTIGTDMLRLIKRFFPSTTVVLVTGQGSEEVAIKALQGGARDYIKKPIKLGELLARVESLFAIRRGGMERRFNEFVQSVEGAPPGDPEEPSRARSILRAMRHIGSNLQTALVLEDVARVAGMSKFHFCRRFKAVMGCSFREFLGRARITRAKELLRNREYTIAEIAKQVGFRDPTHFSRIFREFEHVLPSEYRRELFSSK
jgi:two-component system, response regulator YesN